MSAPNWTLVKRKLKDLKPHPKNPRTLSSDDGAHLQISLEKFGMAEKPIINTDNQIIGGHQRWRLLKKSGIKEIDCWMPDRKLDEKEVEEFLIRLNRNHGRWDFDGLANDFDTIELMDWGFKPEEFLGKLTDDEDDGKEPREPKGKESKGKSLKTCPSCGAEF